LQVQIVLGTDELESGEQPRHADAPTDEYVFALHAMHEADPGNALNVPAGHGAHASPKGVCPALHTQLDEVELPSDE
jgi:hypothetical protein